MVSVRQWRQGHFFAYIFIEPHHYYGANSLENHSDKILDRWCMCSLTYLLMSWRKKKLLRKYLSFSLCILTFSELVDGYHISMILRYAPRPTLSKGLRKTEFIFCASSFFKCQLPHAIYECNYCIAIIFGSDFWSLDDNQMKLLPKLIIVMQYTS